MAVLLLAITMPNVEFVVVFAVAPAAISRLRITLFVAPAATPALVNQIAAVAVDVLLLETVRFRPVPPMRPSIVTLSAPVNLIIAPTIFPLIDTTAVGCTRTLVYKAAPDPLA